MFWVDMKDPGIEVRPIHQMSGGSGFNEVFFTDVRVKDSQRLGGVGDGWKVSLVTLMNERLAVGGATGTGWSQFLEAARDTTGSDGAPLLQESSVREMLDQYGIINDPDLAPLSGGFHGSLMMAPGLRIAGGTDEILRNIIAERVLGLPGDIRLDKDVAFKDVPTGR